MCNFIVIQEANKHMTTPVSRSSKKQVKLKNKISTIFNPLFCKG